MGKRQAAEAAGELMLGFGLEFAALYNRAALERPDRAFLTFLKDAKADLSDRLVQARRGDEPRNGKTQSELLFDIVPEIAVAGASQ